MNFVSKLWRVAILGICSVLVISVATGLVFVIDGFPHLGADPRDWLDWFRLGFLSSLYFGGVAGLLYGVPVYTLYLRVGTFPFWLLALLAIAPGLALLFLEFSLGLFLLFGGAAFLLLVHALAGQWPRLRAQGRPDNSPG